MVSELLMCFTIVWPCIVADFLWIKPTDALNSNVIGIATLHVSGSLSARHQGFLPVHQHRYILRSSILLLMANGSSQLCKIYQSRCMAKNSWWWAERLPETCIVVIPIKLEFSVSVGFIHKECINLCLCILSQGTDCDYGAVHLLQIISYHKSHHICTSRPRHYLNGENA
jgi:hypothetical protein